MKYGKIKSKEDSIIKLKKNHMDILIIVITYKAYLENHKILLNKKILYGLVFLIKEIIYLK
jgi:hypothetical protein